MNFAARVAEIATRFPDHAAVQRVGTDGVRSTTYSSLVEHADGWSALLCRTGVGRGDRVAILGDNDEPWIAAYLGILRIGAIAVPLDTAYRPTQVETVLSHCGARALCVSEKRRAGLVGPSATTYENVHLLTLERLPLSSDPGTATPILDVAPDDAAVILYTSGTTADPKGVVLTHGNLDAELVAALGVVDCHDSDAILGVLPLFHSLAQMANLLVPLSVGARVVFLETISSTSLLAALQERGITIFVCVPQFFYLIHQRVMAEVAHASALRRTSFRLLLSANGWLREHTGWNPGRRWFARVHRVLGPRMRLLVTGGSRFDPQIGRDLHRMGFTLLNGYGLTETSGAATVQRPGDRFTTSVGQPLPGVKIRIQPETPGPERPGLHEMEPRTFRSGEGEVLIRGPIVMREYFGRADATAEALRDGWLHTGDLGYVDEAGRLYITGRRKEVIVLASGKNIYPEEVEAQYQRSPFVKELCVMGLSRPNEPAAERLHAVVVPDEQALRQRGAVNVRELMRFELEGQAVDLPPHKRVLSFDIWQTPLPRTTTGKLKRHEIQRLVKEQAAAGADVVERPLSESERDWLVNPAHAAALRAIATALRREVVAPDANLELDLGLDSMERVELLTALEQRAGAKVPPEVRATIFTVRQLVEAVEQRRSSAPIDLLEAEAGRPLPWEALLAEAPDPRLVRDLDRARGLRGAVFYLAIRTVRAIARLLVEFRISGVEHVPARGAMILSPNHQSHLDGFFVAAALPFGVLQRIFFVGAAEYYQTRGARWLARLGNIVPIDPDANLMTAMQLSAAGLRSQHVLMLFPEGERTIDGEVRTFRKGAAILASHLAVPIVPVALDGPYVLWPRGRRFNWRGLWPGRTRVALAFGAPLSVAPGAYADGTAALQRSVELLLANLRDN